jgi:Tol biopolymer transport system component
MARLVIENLEGELGFGNSSGSAISPDGRVLAFVAMVKTAPVLHVRSLEALQARVLTGTEGAGRPFWSPDSRSIGYFANGKLMRIDLSGGAPQTICGAAVARGGTWNKDGVILFSGRQPGGLQRVSASGGVPAPVTELDATQGEDAHYYPQFLPDGKRFIYYRRRARDATQAGVFAGSLDNADRGRTDKKILDTRHRVVYAPGRAGQPGYLLLIRGTTAFAQRFDPAKLQTVGDPIALAENISLITQNAFSDISASSNDMVAYGIASDAKRVLVWKDRAGKDLGPRIEFPDVGTIRLSPEGKRLASSRPDGTIWVTDLERNTTTRLFFDGSAINPHWSPDGQKIIFATTAGLYVKSADGSGEAEKVLAQTTILSSWSPDGKFVLFSSLTKDGQSDVWAMPMTGDRRPVPVVTGKANEGAGSVSPDGRWLAYNSDETGRTEVYVQGFLEAKGKWMISTGGAFLPRWRADGKELVYLTPVGMLMSVPIQASERGIAPGTPTPLFRTSLSRWDMTADAKRFVVVESAEGDRRNPLVVLLNWQDNLKR